MFHRSHKILAEFHLIASYRGFRKSQQMFGTAGSCFSNACLNLGEIRKVLRTKMRGDTEHEKLCTVVIQFKSKLQTNRFIHPFREPCCLIPAFGKRTEKQAFQQRTRPDQPSVRSSFVEVNGIFVKLLPPIAEEALNGTVDALAE